MLGNFHGTQAAVAMVSPPDIITNPESSWQQRSQWKFSTGSASFRNFFNTTACPPQLWPAPQTPSFKHFWDRINPHSSIKIREMDLFKAENAWEVYSMINIWQQGQVFSQEKPCAAKGEEERVRSRLIYSSRGSSDLAQQQALGFQTNPETISLAPTNLLAETHLQTANTTSTQENEQWSLCGHKNLPCPDALFGTTAQHQLFGGKAYFWAPNESLIKEKHLEENH